MTIEKTISNLIEGQFDPYFKDKGPDFIEFIKAYYEWMESSGNPVYILVIFLSIMILIEQ